MIKFLRMLALVSLVLGVSSCAVNPDYHVQDSSLLDIDIKFDLQDINQAATEIMERFRSEQDARFRIAKICNEEKDRFGTVSCFSLVASRMTLLDFDNALIIGAILENHSPAAILEHNPEAFRNMVLIMHHRPRYINSIYNNESIYRDRRGEIMDVVQNALESGVLSPVHYAWYVDKYLLALGKKSKFGEIGLECIDDRWNPNKIDDLDDLLERRIVLGLQLLDTEYRPDGTCFLRK